MRVSRYGLILALALLAATATTAQKKPAEAPAGKGPVWVDVEAEPGTGFDITKGTYVRRALGQLQQIGPYVYLPTSDTIEVDEETQVRTVVHFPACYMDRGIIRRVVDSEGRPLNLEHFHYVGGLVLATLPVKDSGGSLFRVVANVAERLLDADGNQIVVNRSSKFLPVAGESEHPHFVYAVAPQQLFKQVDNVLYRYRIPTRMAGTGLFAIVGDSVVAVSDKHCYLVSTDSDPLELTGPSGGKVPGVYAETVEVAGPYFLAAALRENISRLYRLSDGALTQVAIPDGFVAKQLFEFGGTCFAALAKINGPEGVDLYELAGDSLTRSKLLAGVKNAEFAHFHRRAKDLIVIGSVSDKKVTTWESAAWRVEASLNAQSKPDFKVNQIAIPRILDERIVLHRPLGYGGGHPGPGGTLWWSTFGRKVVGIDRPKDEKALLLVLSADAKFTLHTLPWIEYPDAGFEVGSSDTTESVSCWDDGGWYLTSNCTRGTKVKPGETGRGIRMSGLRYFAQPD